LTYLERQKSYGLDKLCWEEAEEAEAEEKIRLKQYVSLRSKGRPNETNALPARSRTIKYMSGKETDKCKIPHKMKFELDLYVMSFTTFPNKWF
jgi:hypothetical protein